MTKKKKSRPKFAVADSETDPFLFGRVPKPFLWAYYDGLTFKTFFDTRDFVAYISDIKITIYAHNGGKFDWMFLLDSIEAFYRPTIINGRLSKLKIGKATLVDSYNILPIKLADYQKDEIDYAKFEANVRKNHMPEIIDYLRGDCVYLYELVKTYRDEYGCDLTQAGGAIKTYQKMRGEKVARHSDKILFGEFKQYYHGGRVQCFMSGTIDKPFNVYDINSAYPYAMTSRHPDGLSFVYGDREIPFSDTVRVFYHLSCVSAGAFPYREKPNAALSFPDDDQVREYFVTDWEYWTAKNAGLMREATIIECVVFEQTYHFSEYVYKFYDGRKEAKLAGDKAKDLLYKLRLNSLYGKFGSDYRHYENFIILPDDFESDDWERVDKFGEDNALFSAPLSDDEMKFYNVATAASITGFVRAYLLAAMVNIGRENMLYCDTDSIAALAGSPFGRIPIGGELGQWKNEGAFVRAGIAGKKMYIFEKDKNCAIYKKDKAKNATTRKYKTATKGVQLTDAQLWGVCRGGQVTHRKDSPSFSVTGKARFTQRTIKITA